MAYSKDTENNVRAYVLHSHNTSEGWYRQQYGSDFAVYHVPTDTPGRKAHIHSVPGCVKNYFDPNEQNTVNHALEAAKKHGSKGLTWIATESAPPLSKKRQRIPFTW